MMRVARQAGSRRRWSLAVSQIIASIFQMVASPRMPMRHVRTQAARPHEKVSPGRGCVCLLLASLWKKTGNAQKWQPASSLPARQKVQFMTRECVIILLTRLRRPTGLWEILFYLSERRDITEQPPVVVLLVFTECLLACLPTSASSFSDAMFLDRKAKSKLVGLLL